MGTFKLCGYLRGRPIYVGRGTLADTPTPPTPRTTVPVDYEGKHPMFRVVHRFAKLPEEERLALSQHLCLCSLGEVDELREHEWIALAIRRAQQYGLMNVVDRMVERAERRLTAAHQRSGRPLQMTSYYDNVAGKILNENAV